MGPLELLPKSFLLTACPPYLHAGLSSHRISFWASPETKLPGLVPLVDFFLDNPVS
jgi:hypothetical protein